MRILHCVLGVATLLAAVASTGCNRMRGCPQGMSAVQSRSVPGKALLCKGKPDGTYRWIELQPGGKKPRQTCEFTHSRPEGDYQSFHANGQAWVKGRYVDGVKSGLWLQFDQSGRKVAEGEYRRGHLVGGAPVAMAAVCEQVAL